MHCHEQLTGWGEQKHSQGREYYEALAAVLDVSNLWQVWQTGHCTNKTKEQTYPCQNRHTQVSCAKHGLSKQWIKPQEYKQATLANNFNVTVQMVALGESKL